MHPCRGKQDVIVIIHVFADRAGECVEPRLMTKLVFGLRLDANVFNDGFPPIRRRHATTLGQRGVMRIKSRPSHILNRKDGRRGRNRNNLADPKIQGSQKLGLVKRPLPSAAKR